MLDEISLERRLATFEQAVSDKLQSQKIRVSTIDLRIVVIALSRNLMLLTRNIKDFGLLTED